jgi:hypothetical protein
MWVRPRLAQLQLLILLDSAPDSPVKWFCDSKWFSLILYDKFLGSEQRITYQNQEKLLFSAPNSLVHFKESLLKISQESLLLIICSGAVPNGALNQLNQKHCSLIFWWLVVHSIGCHSSLNIKLHVVLFCVLESRCTYVLLVLLRSPCFIIVELLQLSYCTSRLLGGCFVKHSYHQSGVATSGFT